MSVDTTLTGTEIRAQFLDFFASKGHLKVPTSSLIPRSDPTVLLTTAGMQQMIPYFLGREMPPAVRLTSAQKCFRTTDIDKVGNQRSLTFFEMLGNFSVGDYFKREAIGFAWEFLTQVVNLPADRLHPTVHPTDDEAPRYWNEIAGFPDEAIVRLEDNWWGPPGNSGPCGPDSEIYYDRGLKYGCGKADCKPGCDCERFLEIWNLVFMQYFQDLDGQRTPLPRKNIDTGLGLERLTMVLQGKNRSSTLICSVQLSIISPRSRTQSMVSMPTSTHRCGSSLIMYVHLSSLPPTVSYQATRDVAISSGVSCAALFDTASCWARIIPS